MDENCREAPGALSAEFERLKERGANMLVVGTVPDDVRTRASDRMLGDASAAPRHALFVEAGAEGGTVADLVDVAGDLGGERTVIRHRLPARHTAVANAPPGAATDVVDTGDSLPELAAAVTRAVEKIESSTGSLGPGELRGCFDSLGPLLEEYGRERVFRFLHVVGGKIQSVGGMAHYHLSIDPDAEVVETLAPLFDATVELRTQGNEAQQRWVFRDAPLESDWLPLEGK